MTSKTTQQHLQVGIKAGRLEISIGIETLMHAVKAGPVGEAIPHLRVTDAQAYAREIVRALKDESEDGTTVVHRMLDAAAMEAIDQGAEGVETEGGQPL